MNAEECTVRVAGLEDLEQVIQVELQSFNRDEAYPPWVFMEAITLHPNLFLVIECNNSVKGYAMGFVDGDYCHLTSIAVAPDSRRRGFGRRLLRSFEEACRREGLRRIKLEVKTTNQVALNLYLSEGYRVVDLIRGYYPDGSNAYVMTKDL